MKRVSILFLFFALTSLSSCLNLIEELTLEKDGSGKYAITFDMSTMFSDPMMKGLIEEAVRQQSGTTQNLFAEMDTVVYFNDSPEVQKLKDKRPGFWEKVQMKMKVSEARKEMIATLKIEFQELADIDYFYENINKLGNSSQMGAGLMGNPGSFLPRGALFALKNKQFSRLPSEKKNEMFDSEEMQLAKMLFTDAKYSTIYHLPGKVKKSSVPQSSVKGQTVRAEYPFLDILEGKASIEGDIKFK